MGLLGQLAKERQACLDVLEDKAPFKAPTAQLLRSAQELEPLFDEPAEVIQLTPGRFSGTAQAASIGGGKAIAFNVSCGVALRVEIPADRIMVTLFKPGSKTRVIASGAPVGESDVVLMQGVSATIVALGEIAAVTWTAPAAPASRNSVVPADDQERAELEAFGSERATGVLERLIDRSGTIREQAARSRRMSLFTRAQEHLWAHIEEPHHIDELCAALGCNVRTLFYAFKSIVGMSPMKYFKIQRLNAAHRKLRASEGVPIFCIAADCGFWHMGHFGVDYKRLFGFNASAVHGKTMTQGPRGRYPGSAGRERIRATGIHTA